MEEGTVKWFNATKAYGFIARDTGGDDAFVHLSAVDEAGLGTLGEGDRLRFELVEIRPGRPEARALELVERGEDGTARPGANGAGDATPGEGTVKWFSPEKGYGFIAPDGAGSDVFVHVSAAERAGLGILFEGQRLRYTVRENRPGRFSAEDLAPVDAQPPPTP